MKSIKLGRKIKEDILLSSDEAETEWQILMVRILTVIEIKYPEIYEEFCKIILSEEP